ncbi:MAG: hypothetical protein LBF55_08095 [Prevotellaceae bacterium]|jgi:hypothetical protein|nr:hypothetical protein [Prevotellaceae bacterium]
MKHENISYDELISKLKSASPQFSDPEALTRSIMLSVERLPLRQKQHTALRITGFLSGVAACLLVCLLVRELAWQPATFAAPIPPAAVFSEAYSDRIAAEIEDVSSRSVPEKMRMVADIMQKRRAQSRRWKSAHEKLQNSPLGVDKEQYFNLFNISVSR